MERIFAGFTFNFEFFENGKLVSAFKVHNRMPAEALKYLLAAGFKQGAQYPAFYIGLYEGNYTPDGSEMANTFPTVATELTAYTAENRLPLVLGEVTKTTSSAATDNQDSVPEFTGTTNGKLVTGGFIATASGKGATTGLIASVVRFPSPQPLNAGGVARAKVGFQLESE